IYTVNGLEFTSDTDITLNLSGKQTLNGGAYLFRSDVDKDGKPTSQTFIGLVNGTSTRDLNLNVTLGFHVVDPIIQPKAEATSHDVHTVTWTASYHTEWPHTPDQPPEEPEEPETPETPETPVTPVVPGYDVPKTGDASGLYYVLVILSTLGLALVTLTGRKRRTA
ncbi:MAG: LPXTG cell wall anchor domain-containing protein, partial [Oscillospiraceae bacterium]|nr:LPXTG cell wall anchor domain-containing protein [Oscillospiraceae bacterium]